MTEQHFEHVVADAMHPIIDLDVPSILKESIERQSRNLMGLASSLLHAGMDEQKVRAVIDQACSSYRDELVAAILGLREQYEP